MKFTQVRATAFEEIQLNAGILLSSFDPSTATVTAANILGTTSGGINFTATPSFVDYGEDMDNVPKKTKELMRIDDWDVKMSGTFAGVTADLAETMVGAADSATASGVTTVTPRADLDTTDFADLWWVGDYSDHNGATNGGFIAINVLNGLSTGGFQIQSTDKAKGKFSFEFQGHYSISSPDTVPFKIYVKAGEAEA